jgi:hypothetical protein
VRPRKPRPGGFGHHVRRYYGRCAGCFRWTGTGARRVTPPRAASQETWPEVEKPRPRNFGQSRGGAPRGERARSGRSVQTDGPWRAPRPKRERVATAVGVARSIFSLRLPALRLPSFIWRRNISGFRSCCKTRARTRREAAIAFRPRDSGGGGPLELAQRANRGGGGACGDESLSLKEEDDG